MKIYIATDSRGFRGTDSWGDRLAVWLQSKGHEVVAFKRKICYSIGDAAVEITNHGVHFDLAIMMFGVNEFILPWNNPIWTKILKSPEKLRQLKKITTNTTRYRYGFYFLKTEPWVQDNWEIIKQNSKHQICVTMQSWRKKSAGMISRCMAKRAGLEL